MIRFRLHLNVLYKRREGSKNYFRNSFFYANKEGLLN